MTDTISKEKAVDSELAGASEAVAPTPEPWTAQRVFEWNSYYDLYVAAFVVLLAFLGTANKIPAIDSGIWSLLQAGRQIAETGAPVVTDTTSIAGNGLRWVNIPWVYELTHYKIFQAAASLAPKPDLGALSAKVSGPSEQYGAGALIAVDALARALAALLLLGIRRKGPGLWWSSACVAMALGVTLGPATIESVSSTATGEMVRSIRPWLGVQIGGIASPASVVGPESWGLLLLAVELLLLHQAINLGKTSRLFAMVPLFLIWANMDETFSIGLIILAASAVGLVFDARRERSAVPTRSAWLALGLSFAATFVNPSHVFGVLAGFDSILAALASLPRAVGINLGVAPARSGFLFASNFGPTGLGGVVQTLRFYYVALVGLGLASFALNRRDFSASRFAAFLAAAIFWSLAFSSFTGPFALVLAATLAINGQEWYQRVFGVEGKLGAGWTVWSTGGRLVTLALFLFTIFFGVTGWKSQLGDPQFGFGFNPDDFPFESAEAIRDATIEGGILNTSLPQGDAIAWKAQSKRKAFVDSRQHLYPQSVFNELRDLRNDIKNDDVAKWQPALDRLKISAVMIQLIGSPQDVAPNTYTKLLSSPNWIPFYDDGTVVIFGRADSKAIPTDLAYFKANRLDATERAYKSPRPVAPWERPPTPTWELVDSIFQNRLLNRPQPHTSAALHWLEPANLPTGQPYLPDPARCLMAIREARTALSLKPDDSTAFQVLIVAYQQLLTQESALVAGIALTPENIPKILQSPSAARVLINRNRQLLAAINFRLETLPPSRSPEDQALKANLNYRLAQFYLQGNALDLARDRLNRLAEEALSSGMDENFLKNLTKQLMELNQRVEQVRERMVDLGVNRRASPLDKAAFARANGAPGLAIHELEEVNDAGGNVPGVRPMLVDLYCDAGLPDKALEVIFSLNVDDPTLSSGVGTAAYRQGLIYYLLGNYTNAVNLWQERAIDPLRTRRSIDGVLAGQLFMGGEPTASVKTFLELPEKVNIQAEWEFEIGMVGLEGGLPADFVTSHLQNALKLEPNLTVRPLIAYYLGMLGKEVPPPRTSSPAPATPSTTMPLNPTPSPTGTSNSKDSLPNIELPTLPGSEKPELPPDVFTKDPSKP